LKYRLTAAAAIVAALVLSGSALASSHPHGTTLSVYESTTKRSVLARQGCDAARRGESGIVILDFGKPAYAHHNYGTIDFANRFVSNHQITRGMLGWARGYVHCLPRHSTAFVKLARGTSNYHPYLPSARLAGKRWAGAVLTLERKLHRNGLASHVDSAAADDAEPAWDRSFRQTHRFIAGFRRWAHGRTLYDYGSLDGGVGSIWSARQFLYVVGGNRHTAVLPEIYYRSTAREWAQLAYVAHHWFHKRVHFAGVMTQGTPSCGSCGFRPQAAHRALIQELSKVDAGATHVPRGGTNIGWG
jgi:hypothetical protein